MIDAHDSTPSRWLAADLSVNFADAAGLMSQARSRRSHAESTNDGDDRLSEQALNTRRAEDGAPSEKATSAHYMQDGDNNTMINAENYNDNTTTIKHQQVLGSINLDNAHIQRVIQNRFSGPISIRTASIAGTSSVFTAFSAATDLQRSAVKLQQKLLGLFPADIKTSDIYLGLLRFQSLLQQVCDSFANPSHEHRRDLLTLQDYFVVLIQAQRLVTRIEKDIDDGQVLSLEESLRLISENHQVNLNMLNNQLSDQVDVLITASYTVAQATATKVMQTGDQSAIEFYGILSNINRQVEQAQTMLRSITDQSVQAEEAVRRKSTLSSRPEYEEALRNSPAYSRLSLNYRSSARFSMSTRASSARTEAWPALDLVSLANVSIISVIGLPVSWNKLDGPYEELETIAEEVEEASQVSGNRTTVQRSLSQRVRDVTGYASIPRRQNLFIAVEEGNEALVKRLLDFGVRPDYVNPLQSRTPLAQAVYQGNLNMVRMILASHPLVVNEHPRPLCLAVKRDHAQIAKELLDYRLVNVNYTDEYEVVAIHLAVELNHPEIVAILLNQHDLEVNCINRRFQTPLEVAVTNGYWQIVKLLVEDNRTDVNTAWIRENALNSAIQGNHLAIVEILLSIDRVDARIKDSQGREPLVAAIECGHTAIAQALIASDKIFLAPSLRRTDGPLYAAAKKPDLVILALLLDRAGITQDEAMRFLVSNISNADMSPSIARMICAHEMKTDRSLLPPIVRHAQNIVIQELIIADRHSSSSTAMKESPRNLVRTLITLAISLDQTDPRACPRLDGLISLIVSHYDNEEVATSAKLISDGILGSMGFEDLLNIVVARGLKSVVIELIGAGAFIDCQTLIACVKEAHDHGQLKIAWLLLNTSAAGRLAVASADEKDDELAQLRRWRSILKTREARAQRNDGLASR